MGARQRIVSLNVLLKASRNSIRRAITDISSRIILVEDNSSLDSTLIFHRSQAFPLLLQLEGFIYYTSNLDLAGIKIVDGSRKHKSLRERAKNRDFITENLARQPRHSS